MFQNKKCRASRKKNFSSCIAYILVLICLELLLFTKLSQNPHPILQHNQTIIHIGTVVCGGTAYLNSSSNLPMESEEEVLTLIKSIYISAISYNVTQPIEITIFTDTYHLQNRIRKNVHNYQNITNGQVQLKFSYHSTYKSLPEGYEKVFVDGNVGSIRSIPCGHVRLFFPNSFPTNIKHALYLDTDVIVTGNISRIWEKMGKSMKSDRNETEVFALMVLNTERNDNWHMGLYKAIFSKIPHVPPRGVNSGVMFMNLEAMREYNWSGMVMSTHLEYGAAQENDQNLINIFFHNHPYRLKLTSCQYNFMHVHCEITLNCEAARKDADGIQILHGAGGRFSGSLEKAHKLIYEKYKQFDLRNINQVEKQLYGPIKSLNNVDPASEIIYNWDWDNCRGTIGQLLYTALKS